MAFCTLINQFLDQSRIAPDRIAYTYLPDKAGDEPVSFTYAALNRKAQAIAATLQAQGAEGERALLLFPPGIEFIPSFLGCLYAGVVAVPAYPPRKNGNLDRIENIIADCRAKVILTTESTRKHLDSQFKELVAPGLSLLTYETIDEASAASWQRPALSDKPLAFLQYTSGSTGIPKGVMVGHDNLLSNLEDLALGSGHTPDSVMVSWLPAFHDLGLIAGILLTMYNGATCYLMSPVAFMTKPTRWMKAVSDFRATHTVAPNFAFEQSIIHTDESALAELDLSSLIYLGNCAEPIKAETLSRFQDLFAGAKLGTSVIKPGYGLAEATLKVTAKSTKPGSIQYVNLDTDGLEQHKVILQAEGGRRFVGCGTSEIDTTVRIVNPTKKTVCAPDEVGEIWVSGQTVAYGYWERPDQTEEVFQAFLADTGEGPFLRTGDLGFCLNDELYVTGRIKDLVIIHGKNHYPQDIEQTVEKAHPALRKGCTAAFAVDGPEGEQLVIVQEIAGPYVKQLDVDAVSAIIREKVGQEHALDVASLVLIEPLKIPKTSSGKIQRRECKRRYLAGLLPIIGETTSAVVKNTDAETNLTATQAAMQSLWQARLGQSHVGIRDNFFALGGDSIKAVQLTAAINDYFKTDLSARDLFDSPTIEALVQCLEGERQPVTAIEPLPQREGYDLSPIQKSMWLMDQNQQTRGVSNITVQYDLDGMLNPVLFQTAWHQIGRRHEALRTRFSEQAGTVQQTIDDEPTLIPEWLDWQYKADWKSSIQKLGKAENRQPFDLSKAPLLRVKVVQTSTATASLLLTIHHSIADEWSLNVLMQNVLAAYASLVQGEEKASAPLRIQYKEFVNWQQQLLQTTRGRDAADFWKNEFETPPTPLAIPTDFARKATRTYNGASVSVTVDAERTEALKEFGHRQGTTLFMSLLAGLQLLLHRYTGQNDIVVGTPVAGREHPEWMDQIGCYINTLALRQNIDVAQTVMDHLAYVRQRTTAAFAHQQYPFEQLLASLAQPADKDRSPLFDVMLVLYNTETTPLTNLDQPLRIADGNPVTAYSKYDFTILAKEKPEGLVIQLVFNTDLFTAEWAERMLMHYQQLLNWLVAHPDETISSACYLQETERMQLIEAFNQTALPKPSEQTITEWFEQTVSSHPDQRAIVFGNENLTYQQLNERANQQARQLRQVYGVGPQSLVAVQVTRSAELIVSVLAILKTGASYLPIDPTCPSERLAYLLDDSRSVLLITDRPEVYAGSIPAVQPDALKATDQSTQNLSVKKAPTDPVYTIYTSGSTGRPKGVTIPEMALQNYVYWFTTTYQIEAKDSTLLLSSVAFDLSYTSLWPALLSGSTLHILPEEDHFDGAACLQVLLDNNISFVKLTPSHFGLLLDQPDFVKNAQKLALRLVVLGGEKIRPDDITRFQAAKSTETLFVNHYGPTETTIGTIAQTIGKRDVSSSNELSLTNFARRPVIGRPIANAAAYIVDDQLRLQGIGVWGELCIAGPGLAVGYLGNPELTAQKFVNCSFGPHRRMYRTGDIARRLPDGCIELMGRIDTQVKIRGYRIELGEIEQALRQHPAVTEAAVTVYRDGLVAYYTTPSVVDTESLRHFLATQLPPYMVPVIYVALDAFPLLGNGKIDRKRLPEPTQTASNQTECITPQNANEQVLAGAVAQVLGRERVSLTDDFFRIGGDSIKAMQVVSVLYKMGYRLEVRNLFQHPVLTDAATLVTPLERRADQGPVQGHVALTPIQHDFFSRKYKKPNQYTQSVLLKSDERLDAEAVRQTLQLIQTHHDALRTVFVGPDQQAYIPEIAQPFELVILQLQDQPDAIERLNEAAQLLQESIDPAQGSLFKAILFRMEDSDRLLLVCHHLVIDGVSWRILLEDFGTAYQAFNAGTDAQLPLKTDSYQAWSRAQHDYVQNPVSEQEMPYWNATDAVTTDRCFTPTQLPEQSIERSFRATAAQTEQFLNRAASANPLLMTALLLALDHQYARGRYRILMEGHGREELTTPLNLSRTVGWFTALYPCVFDVASTDSLDLAYERVQQVLSGVPNKGVGYGMYRYLRPVAGVTANRPSICFNYLGDFTQSIAGSGLTIATEDWKAGQPDEEQPLYDLSVVGMIQDNELIVRFIGNNACLRTDELTELANTFKEILSGLLAKPINETVVAEEPEDWTTIEALPEQAYYEVSSAQKRLWFLHQLDDTLTAYNMVRALHMQGDLNRPAFEQALQKLVNRHESLRTNIISVNGTPKLVIHPAQSARVAVDYRDFSRELDAEQRANAFFRTVAETPFDLSADALVRFNLARLAEKTYVFQYVIHHSVADGWSLNNLHGELMHQYTSRMADNPVAMDALPIQYKEFAVWQNHYLDSPQVQQQRRYWAQQLAGELPVLQLLTDYQRPTHKTYRSAGYTVALGTALSQQVRQQASAVGTSPFAVLLATVQTLLHRYTGQNELIVGTPVAGRNHPALHSQVGLFLNALPIRTLFSPQETFASLLNQTRRAVQEALIHQDYPFDRIVEDLGIVRDISRSPLFDVMVIHEEFPAHNQQWANMKVSAYEVDFCPNKYDLTIYFQETEGQTVVRIEYNVDLFSPERIAKMGRHLIGLVRLLLENTEAPINEVDYLEADEKVSYFNQLNQSNANFDYQSSLHTLFERQVVNNPDAVAIRHKGMGLSYGELNRRANQLARHLQTLGVQPGDQVGLVSDRNQELITGMFAILKTGASYVPVDATAPVLWRNGLLTVAAVRLILTDQPSLLNTPQGMQTVPIWSEAYGAYDAANHQLQAAETACVLPAMSATGEPNAVRITHQSVVNLVHWVNETYGLKSGEKALFVRPLNSDLSLYDIFGMLTSGGTVVIAGRDDIRTDQQLKAILDEENITVWNTAPATVAYLLSNPQISKQLALKNQLKVVFLNGDSLPGELGRKLNQLLPTTKWIWAGAATEGAIRSSFQELTSSDIATVNCIGKPMPNTYYYVLDAHHNWVPQGVAGELYIGGMGVSPGFVADSMNEESTFVWNKHNANWSPTMVRTGDRVRMRPDGSLEFLGNVANKERGPGGYRVHNEGIAAVIKRFNGVTDATVRVVAKPDGASQLLAYYMADQPLATHKLRKYLGLNIPEYLIPSAFIPVKDIGYLGEAVEPANSPVSLVALPRNATEEQVLTIWEGLLNRKSIGLQDNFFALGGHSLLVWQMSLQIEESMGIKVPLKIIFSRPTIEQLAAEIDALHWVSRASESESELLTKILL